ncbi:hypothetical protein BH24BAC1_BH24BAC1_08990 [soil metagenome]
MKNSLLFCFLVLLQLPLLSPYLAQTRQGPMVSPDARALGQLATKLEREHKLNRERALELAPKKGWAVERVYPDGTVISLQGVDETGQPIYYTTYSNARSAATTRTDQLWPGGGTGLDLSGSSPVMAGKLGIWDGGRVRLSHREFNGRVTQRDNAQRDDTHATHVAGTMIARGVNELAKGMAFGAPDLQAFDFTNHLAEMATAAAAGMLISNHSYGSLAGWEFNRDRAGTAADPNWQWHGNLTVSQAEDVKFGYYNNEAREWDRITYNAPYYLPVKSAGNNRNVNGPQVGQPYWRFNGSGVRELVPERAADMSSNNTFNSIPTYGTAKNTLTVGATDPIAFGYNQASDVKITVFSSFGPTDDGRIKPDVVGNGLNVLSSSALADDSYAVLGGTSMSAPNISGSLHLLQELYHRQNNGTFMRAATLKGLAIHTAEEAGPSPGPDYTFGWGLLNAARAGTVIANSATNLIQERTLAQGQTYTFQVEASGAGPLLVTISWTDPEAEVIAVANALNNRTPRLVNDLDVRVARGNNTYRPWVLDPANPTNPATPGDNVLDNVEQIWIPDAIPGETYTLTVSHKGTLQRGPQAYSLLVSGIGGVAYCPSAPQSTADSKITQFSFGAPTASPITYTAPAGCAGYTNLTPLSAGVQLGQAVPLSLTAGTCGANQNKIAKVYIDWNGNGIFTDPGELVATSGVLSGTGTFTTTVNVPLTVTIGNITRMRVVLVETTDPAQVLPCGSYGKGETQDYTIFFLRPAVDVGPNGLLLSQLYLCPNDAQRLTVSIRNFGTTPVTNVPVATSVRTATGEVAVLSGTFTGVVPAFGQAEFTYAQSFTTAANTTYTFITRTNLPGDNDPTNNEHRMTLRVGAPTPPPVARALVCGNDPLVLQGEGEGTVFWYDAPTGGNLLAAGSPAFTINRPPGGVFYAALNDFRGSFGPRTKNEFGGGGYNSFTPDVLLRAQVPLVIERARLYIGNPGRIIFTLESANGTPLSTATLDVQATRTTPAPGAQPDDPNDPGAVYDLNLVIPSAGEYRIKIDYAGGATIFRNNAGVSGYPFGIPNVVSITGNTATTTPSQFYYYFYDIQVKATGCPSPRIAVPTVVSEPAEAIVTPQGPTTFCGQGEVLLRANTGQGLRYQWQKDGLNILGATQDTLRATATGAYTVVVTNTAGCSKTSNQVVMNIFPIPPKPVITQQERTLVSSAAGGNQWYLNGEPIPGAVQPTYTPTRDGIYTVVVTLNGCPTNSDPFRFTQADFARAEDEITNLWIFPNPSTTGTFRVRFNVKSSGVLQLRFVDVVGQLVYQESAPDFTGNYDQEISLTNLASGIYFLRLQYNNRVLMRKVVIAR